MNKTQQVGYSKQQKTKISKPTEELQAPHLLSALLLVLGASS